MEGVHELRRRADRSRQAGYAAPVVTSVDEAKALAGQIADQIASLPPRERLLMLTHLDDICEVIQTRLGRLEVELQDTRSQLTAANDGGAACVSYAAAGAIRARPDGSR